MTWGPGREEKKEITEKGGYNVHTRPRATALGAEKNVAEPSRYNM